MGHIGKAKEKITRDRASNLRCVFPLVAGLLLISSCQQSQNIKSIGENNNMTATIKVIKISDVEKEQLKPLERKMPKPATLPNSHLPVREGKKIVIK